VVLDDTKWPLPGARSANASPAPLVLIALTRADPAHEQCGDALVACPFPSCKQRYTDVKALRMHYKDAHNKYGRAERDGLDAERSSSLQPISASSAAVRLRSVHASQLACVQGG